MGEFVNKLRSKEAKRRKGEGAKRFICEFGYSLICKLGE